MMYTAQDAIKSRSHKKVNRFEDEKPRPNFDSFHIKLCGNGHWKYAVWLWWRVFVGCAKKNFGENDSNLCLSMSFILEIDENIQVMSISSTTEFHLQWKKVEFFLLLDNDNCDNKLRPTQKCWDIINDF